MDKKAQMGIMVLVSIAVWMIVFTLVYSRTTFAQALPSPPAIPSLGNMGAWVGVLDNEGTNQDLLLMVEYTLPADGEGSDTASDWDDYRGAAYIVLCQDVLCDSDVTGTLQQVTRIGPGIVTYYLSDWDTSDIGEGDRVAVRLFSDPLTFSSVNQARKSTVIVQALDGNGEYSDVDEGVIGILRSMEESNTGTGAFQFGGDVIVRDGKITTLGASFIANVSALLRVIIPQAFEVTTESLLTTTGENYVTPVIGDIAIGDVMIQVENALIFSEGQTILLGNNAGVSECKTVEMVVNSTTLMVAEMEIAFSENDSSFARLWSSAAYCGANAESDWSDVGELLGLSGSVTAIVLWLVLSSSCVFTSAQVFNKPEYGLMGFPAFLIFFVISGWIPVEWLAAILVLSALLIGTWFITMQRRASG